MERRNSKEWIKSLKIAIINKDLDKLEEYSKREIPKFSSIEEAKKALNLVNQASNILTIEKEKIGNQLKVFKQQKQYFQTDNTTSFSFEA